MTIDEAIKELTKQSGPKYSTPNTDFHNALKLGIEALKHIQAIRHSVYSDLTGLLPGETEE